MRLSIKRSQVQFPGLGQNVFFFLLEMLNNSLEYRSLAMFHLHAPEETLSYNRCWERRFQLVLPWNSKKKLLDFGATTETEFVNVELSFSFFKLNAIYMCCKIFYHYQSCRSRPTNPSSSDHKVGIVNINCSHRDILRKISYIQHAVIYKSSSKSLAHGDRLHH